MNWIIEQHQLAPSVQLSLPRGAVILSAQAQGEYIVLFEMHDAAETGHEKRSFITKPSNEEFANPPEGYSLRYISTCQFVIARPITAPGESPFDFRRWHVFEVEKTTASQ